MNPHTAALIERAKQRHAELLALRAKQEQDKQQAASERSADRKHHDGNS